MKLDPARDYVALDYFDGTPGAMNFIAVAPNGDIVDVTTETADNRWVIVHLEQPGRQIAEVYMHQVTDQSSSCEYACAEPYITNIEACNHSY